MTTSVAVEGQFCGITAFRISFLESGCDKTGAGGMGDAVPDDSAGKQVDDSAKVDFGIVDFKIGDIAAHTRLGQSAVKCRCNRFRFCAAAT